MQHLDSLNEAVGGIDVREVRCPLGGLSNIAYAKIYPLGAGDSKQALGIMLTCSKQGLPKIAMVFDTDVDIWDDQAVLAAMASVGEGATASDVVAWLDANEVGWAPPSGNGHAAETRQGALRSAVSNLRSAFADLPIGLERFGPPPQGFSVAGVEVDIG